MGKSIEKISHEPTMKKSIIKLFGKCWEVYIMHERKFGSWRAIVKDGRLITYHPVIPRK